MENELENFKSVRDLFPEHEKLNPDGIIIKDFLEWLFTDQNKMICGFNEKTSFTNPYPVAINKSADYWVNKFLGIDAEKLEAERREIARQMHEAYSNH